MSLSSLNDDWVKPRTPRELQSDILTWTTSISRSRVSTVDGLGFGENIDVESMNSLESLLHTVQKLKLKRFRVENLDEIRTVGNGETFAVSECKYEAAVVAIKRIRLSEEGNALERSQFQRRLQSVLREILIMCHPPLMHHPNIIDILGYGWSVERQRLSPFISVAFASKGTLRDYMKGKVHPIRTKLILMGDVGSGLMALHKCGIVHGDLKLDNVVVFSSLDRPCMSIAKVSDFGHSIILGSASENKTQYFGTTLYNAPEVAEQKDHPIPIEQLHKCDIWAFGLCAWEILADGQLYFQRSWRRNPLYERSSSLSISLVSPTGSEAHDEFSIDEDDQHVFGYFDLSHLKTLAIEFVNNMKIPGIGFEKGFLRPLMDRTLQIDPARRISDLSRLPIIVSWHKTPGGHSLQSKLATYAISGDVRYSIFSRESGPYIIWEQQQQLLQDFEIVAQGSKSDKDDGSIAFQTMLCYVNAFGTSQDLSKATEFLQIAKDSGHLVARILGPRILNGFNRDSTKVQPYSECLAEGFQITRKPELITSLVVHDEESVTEFTNYAGFREAFSEERSRLSTNDKDGALRAFITSNKSTLQQSLLDIAVQQGDVEFVERLLPSVDLSIEASKLDPYLVSAASRGHDGIVISILKAGARISLMNTAPSLLHWLFCLSETTLRAIHSFLKNQSRNVNFKSALNHATTESIILHPQWPFQVHGSPLAVAIASGSLPVVKLLLDLGADPLAPAFKMDGDNTDPSLTAIHLAVKYHRPDIFRLLWKGAFGETKPVSGAHEHLFTAFGSFPIACSLSLLTNAERFAIHGRMYKQRLHETIKLLSLEFLLQSSPEGRNSITQAIDLEDVDTVELLLEHGPSLASSKLVQPGSKNMFTYPFHFAVQIASCRDTRESEQIVASILKLDPAAIIRPDSARIKPLHIAAMGTSDRMTKFLLDRDVSCHDFDGRGRTPLHFCRTLVNAKTLMLRGGVNINHRDDFLFSPVHAAASQGADEVLKMLIDAGADLTLANNEIGTPLHCAVQRKSRTTIELLLAAGADVKAKNRHGRTPLHLAMDTGRSDLVLLLFQAGADPFDEDKKGYSPFSMSLAWENPSIFNIFKLPDHFAVERLHIKALIFAAAKGETAVFRQYLDKLPDPSRNLDCVPLPNLYVTAINVAAGACRADLVKILLAHGFNVDTLDEKKNTPLLRACQAGRTDSEFFPQNRTHVCETLIQHGANTLARNDRGLTPLLVAKSHTDYPLMTLLLSQHQQDLSTRISRVLESIKDPEVDDMYHRSSRALIGGEIIDPHLVWDAAQKDEWEFVMTCVAGHFVNKNDLKKNFPYDKSENNRVDTLDMLRYHSVRMDREMVQYLASGTREIIPGFWRSARSIGLRNFEVELYESRDSLNVMLWPEATRKALDKLLVESQFDPSEVRQELEDLQRQEETFCNKLQEYFTQIFNQSKKTTKSLEGMLWFKEFEQDLALENRNALLSRLQTLIIHTEAMKERALRPEDARPWVMLIEQAKRLETWKTMIDSTLYQAKKITTCFFMLSGEGPEHDGMNSDLHLDIDDYGLEGFWLDHESYIKSSTNLLKEMNQRMLLFGSYR
ncbi:Ankyrin-3 [Penicillium rolfsii]|nr:Ankyrin-3 [Penicillium rolfsii]